MKSILLTDIQTQFQQCLLDGLQNTPDWIKSQQRISAEKRLDIYREAYRLRLIETLAADYPACKAVMGDAIFVKWCDRYIKAYPSQHYSLRYFGKNFYSFLKINNELYLSELAQFEWLLSCAFDAFDANSVTRDALAAIAIEDWAMLRLQLHPSVHLCELNCNAPAIWQEFSQTSVVLDFSATENQKWIVWRQNLAVYFRPLSLSEFTLLNLLTSVASWPTLCEAGDRFYGESSAQEIAQFLHLWVNDGVLCFYQGS